MVVTVVVVTDSVGDVATDIVVVAGDVTPVVVDVLVDVA